MCVDVQVQMGVGSCELCAAVCVVVIVLAVTMHAANQSHHYMLVLATNRPGELDSAIQDRMDETVEFPMPTLAEREQMVSRYFQEHILDRAEPGTVLSISSGDLDTASSGSDNEAESKVRVGKQCPCMHACVATIARHPSPITHHAPRTTHHSPLIVDRARR